MKVLMLNGSPRAKGNTALALEEMEKIFKEEQIETEILHIGHKDIRGCIACRQCAQKGKCVFDDVVNETAPKFEQADGLVVGAPVYYASANATLIAYLTRLFYSTHFDKSMKVGAAVAVARRGGITAAYDELNKFFGHLRHAHCLGAILERRARRAGEAAGDTEGLQQMRTLARNMAFLMRGIQLAKERYGLPQKEPLTYMNFIREGQ